MNEKCVKIKINKDRKVDWGEGWKTGIVEAPENVAQMLVEDAKKATYVNEKAPKSE